MVGEVRGAEAPGFSRDRGGGFGQSRVSESRGKRQPLGKPRSADKVVRLSMGAIFAHSMHTRDPSGIGFTGELTRQVAQRLQDQKNKKEEEAKLVASLAGIQGM